MRRPTTLWAASLALLSAPLLMLGDAAPTPQRQYQHNRRYLVPVRRQTSNFGKFPNGSGDSPPPAAAPSSQDPATFFSQSSIGPQDAGPNAGPVYVSTTASYAPSNTPQADSSPSTVTPPAASDPASDPQPTPSSPPASPDNSSPSPAASSSAIYVGLGDIVSSTAGSPQPASDSAAPSSTQMASPPAQNAAPTGSATAPPASDGSAAAQAQASPSSQPTSSQAAAAHPAVLPADANTGSADTASSAPASSASAAAPSDPASSGSAPAAAAATNSAPAGSASSAPSGVVAAAGSAPTGSAPPAQPQSAAPSGGAAPATSGSGSAPTSAAAQVPSSGNAQNQQTSAAAPPPASDTAVAVGGATGAATGGAPAAPSGSATGAATGGAPAPVVTPPAQSGGAGTAPAGAASAPPAAAPTSSGNAAPAAVVVPPASQSQGSAAAPGQPLMTASLQSGAINLPLPSGTASAPAVSAADPLASPAKIPATSSQPSAPTVGPALIPAVNHNSVAVTGTNTETALSIATTLLLATTIPSAPDASLASSAPKVIKPADGVPTMDPDETLCRVGFTKELNYMFMVENYQAVNQMFTYLPEGIQYGINATIRMQSLQPLNTLKTDGFVTCMAYFLCPKSKVNTLALQLHTPNSPLYNNSNPQVATMMRLINPQYPLLVDGSMGSFPSSAATNAAVAPGQPEAGSPFGPDAVHHQEINRTSSYVAVPVVAGAFMYASAMMIVARRYRQKRRRSHMLEDSPVPEPAWMSGRRSMAQVAADNSRDSQGSGNLSGRSIRSQPISAPVMAQNSLGWN